MKYDAMTATTSTTSTATRAAAQTGKPFLLPGELLVLLVAASEGGVLLPLLPPELLPELWPELEFTTDAEVASCLPLDLYTFTMLPLEMADVMALETTPAFG